MDRKLQSLKNYFTPKRLILLVLAFIILIVAIKGWRIGIAARALYADLTQVQAMAAAPTQIDPAQIEPLVHQVHQDLIALETEVAPFYGVLRRLAWLPTIGGDVAAVPEFLPMGVALAAAGDAVMPVLSPVVPQVLQRPENNDDLLASAAEAIAQNPDAFSQAAESVDTALAYRAEIDAATLSPALAKQVNRLEQGLPLLKLGLELAPAAPDFLGVTEPKTYLLIAQNNDELRATGGFISAVGTLTLTGGRLGDLTFEDSYAIDDFSHEYPPVPGPLKRIMSAYIWVFRDGNWSPDFPTAVNDMLNLYHISRDTKIDGVIAVDQLALRDIVQALEPVSVPIFDEPATGKNVLDLIRQSWSPQDPNFKGWDAEWYQQRKNFMGDLVAALRKRVEREPASVNWQKLIAAILKTLAERHVQIWLANPDAQTVIHQQGWDGAIRQGEGDYLMIVDTNVGFNKMNAVAETTFDYQVNLSALDSPSAALTVRQANPSQSVADCNHTPRYGKDYWAMMDRCYWDYLRIFAPADSQLVSSTPHAVPGKYLLGQVDEPAQVETLPPAVGKSIWGTLVLVPRQQSMETTFEYDLPARVVSRTEGGWRYHLTLQKQAGTAGVTGRVSVQLPPNSTVQSVSPEPTAITPNGQIEFNVTLNVDQDIRMVFE